MTWEDAGREQPKWAVEQGVVEAFMKPKEKEILAWLKERENFYDD